jgi:hypothetical protein
LSDQTRHSLTYRSRATVLHGVLPISCKPHPYPPSAEGSVVGKLARSERVKLRRR